MGGDQNQDNPPQAAVQMQLDHQIELRTQHHRPNGDKHRERLHADIDFFAEKVHPVYHISSHGSYQQRTGYRGQ
ncbi:hypothetical protein D3C81_2092280 [compost metagenome]